jgi:hypothetical protein
VLRNLDLASSLPQQLEGMLLPLVMNSKDLDHDRTTPDNKSEHTTTSVRDQMLQVTMSTLNRNKIEMNTIQ